MINQFGELMEEDEAYTGRTQPIPQVRHAAMTHPQQSETEKIKNYALIGLAAFAIWIAASKSGNVGPRPEPSWQPPPAQTTIKIEDNSWNWNVCGVCTRGNASPHFEIQQP